MADDIATLGFNVDSAGLVQATADGSKFTDVAKGMALTIDQITERQKLLTQARAADTAATEKQTSAIKAAADASAKQVAAATQLGTVVGKYAGLATANTVANAKLITGMSSVNDQSLRMITGMSASGKAIADAGSKSLLTATQWAALSKAGGVLLQQAESNAESLGGLGRALLSFGVAGVAVGATLGALALGFEKMNEAAQEFGRRAIDLRNFSTITGLSTDALQTLEHAAAELGITSEQVRTSLDRFTVNLNEARKGVGPLYEGVLAVNDGLADQLKASRDNAIALDVLAQAFAKAGTSAGALTTAAGGRGGIAALPPLLDKINASGGLKGLEESMHGAVTRTKEVNDQVADLKGKLDAVKEENANLFAKVFTADFLQKQIAFQDWLRNIIIAFGDARSAANTWIDSTVAALGKAIKATNDWIDAIPLLGNALKAVGLGAPAGGSATSAPVAAGPGVVPPGSSGGTGIGIRGTDLLTLESIANKQKDINAAMGAGVTLTQQLAAKEAALDVARKKGIISEQQYVVALGAERAAVSLEQLNGQITLLGNLATVDQLVAQKQGEINAALTKGIPLTEKQIAQITEVARLQAIATKSANTVSALGEAATAAEKYKSQLDELNVKLADSTLNQDQFNRAARALNPTLKAVQDAVAQVGDGLAQAFLHGANAADALHNSLQAVASTATSATINNLIKGDLGAAAISASVAAASFIGSKLFGGGHAEEDQKKQAAAAEAERQRVEREKQVADAQIRAADFSLRAANAMEKSNFIVAITTFDSESTKAFDTESKLAGSLAIWQLVAARAAERQKLISDTIDAATTTLSGDALTEVQQRLKDINSAATELGNALIFSGQAAGDAAQAVAEKFNPSLAKLVSSFTGSIASQINDLTGSGFINQANDLLAKVAQMRSDAATLGVQTDQIDRLFLLSAQKIVDDTKLTGDQFNELSTQLGLTGTSLHAFIDTVVKAGVATDDLVRQVNALAGGDWINQITDLVAQVGDLRSQGNLDPSLIENFFVLSAQKIVDQAQLTGVAFDSLVNASGLAGTSLHAFDSALENTGTVAKRTAAQIAAAIQTNQDALFSLQQDQTTLAGKLAVFDLQAQRAREAEVAAGGQALVSLEELQAQQRLNVISDFAKQQADDLQKQLDAETAAKQKAADEQQRILDEATKFVSGQIANIQQYIQHVNATNAGSASPAQQLNNAQTAFNTQFVLAQGGNRDALQGITGNASDVIAAAKAYYGSSLQGQTIINNTLSNLSALTTSISPEQFIVNGINTAITGQTNDPKFTTLNTDNTSQSVTLLQQTLDAATKLATVVTGTNHLAPVDISTTNAATSLLAEAQISSNTGNIAGNTATMSVGLLPTTNSTLLSIFNELVTIQNDTAGIRADLGQQNLFWPVNTNGYTNIGHFREGGLVSGQGSGYSDSNIIAVSRGEFIVNAAATARNLQALQNINRGGSANDNGQVVAALGTVGEVLADILNRIADNTEARTKYDRRTGT